MILDHRLLKRLHKPDSKSTDRKVGRLDDVHIKTGGSTFAEKVLKNVSKTSTGLCKRNDIG